MDEWTDAVVEAFNASGNLLLDTLEPYVSENVIVVSVLLGVVSIWLSNLPRFVRGRATGRYRAPALSPQGEPLRKED